MKSDYLKYWRVVRQYVKVKYGLTQSDLDILLFLQSEGYFNKDRFEEFHSLLSWDKQRFERLRKDGWIVVFRKHAGRIKALYCLSNKSKRVIIGIYKKLEGEEIPTSKSWNPMFLRKVSYTDKVYRNFIIRLNKEIRDAKK